MLSVVVLFAQAPVKVSKNVTTPQQVKYSHATGFEVSDDIVTPQMIRNGSGNLIGNTNYNVISNGTSRNTITSFPDGTAAAVWTTSSTESSTRGTGYNYFNGTSWGAMPSSDARIESVRTGFGIIAPLGAGEIVVAHSRTGLVFNKRAAKGTGA